MKTLIVYCGESFFKYPELYESFCYTIEHDSTLEVTKRDIHDGGESVIAVYRNWDYFLIEESPDD